MKTYKETITRELPCLVIEYDINTENPRKSWDNLGYFFTSEGRHISPDGTEHEIYDIMKDTANEASDTENHIKLMKKRINSETNEKVLAIYPVYRYEHSSVLYRRGTAHGFDYSNCGFYIITDKTQKVLGTPKKSFEKVVDEELDIYTKWANGEVYGFILKDENGEDIDSCWGYYDLEQIRSELPAEYQKENLRDYIKN